MKSKSFRLQESAIEQLKQIAEARNENQTTAIQFAIQKGYDAIQLQYEELINDTDWKDLYFAEKNRNDEMAKKLMELSDKVADSLQAAQVLHGADKAEIKQLESQEQKLTRWQRLKKAWRE